MYKRPELLDEIIGQDRAKQTCRILIDSSKQRKAPIPHMLFSGAAGTGKTTFAGVMAKERGVSMTVANAGSVNTVKSILYAISDLKPNQVFFIDEIHRLPIKVCEWLYPVMEDFRYEITNQLGILKSAATKPFTMIGATTLLGKMPKPLKERFKATIEFVPYTLDELKEIVIRTSKGSGITGLNDKVTTAIAKTCRGNPRRIIARTEWIRDCMIASGGTSMSIKEVWDVIELQGVDKNGLEDIDKRYLQILRDDHDGIVSLNALASKLSTDTQTVQTTIEPYLMQIGLIDISRTGRFLMTEEYKKLGYK